MQDAQTPCNAFTKLSKAIGQVIRAEVELGQTLVRSMVGAAGCPAGDSMMGLSRRLGSCCDIPSPCWAPQHLGDLTSHVSPCSSASLELQIENNTLEPRRFEVAVAGYGNVVVTPGNPIGVLALRRQTVHVSATIPQGTKIGDDFDLTVVVIGCRIYYLHWNLRVSALGLNGNHRIVIKDGPDHIHHWYDHFYVVRPCMSANTNPKAAPAQGNPPGPVENL